MTVPFTRTLIVDLPGPQLDPTWRAHLERHRFGGVCLFRRNIETSEQTARLVTEIREILGPEALIGIDQEGGTVLRLLDVPQPPSAMAIGATRDPALAFEVGALAARGLIGLGINWNYAPVLDVQSNPDNPVIGERSFGSDPQLVAELGVAWARGLESQGVMASVKHFPGHGDTNVDSHLDLPVVGKSTAELESCEWLPFRRAVEAGVGSIMTAHILYPSLDPDAPATLSPRVLTGLLRETWGYDGVVVTDSTDMLAVARRHPNGEAAPLSLIAGADAVLACTHGDLGAQEAQIEAIGRALAEGRLSEARVQEAIRRLSDAAARFPGAPRPYDDEARRQDDTTVREASLRALTALGATPRPTRESRLVIVGPDHADVGGPYEDRPTLRRLGAVLSEAFAEVTTLPYPRETPLSVLDDPRLADADLVLFVTASRWALDPDEVELARRVARLGPPALHIALWNPYHAARLDLPALVTYGFRDAALLALRDVLLGAPAEGRLPVDLPSAHTPA